MLRYLWMLSSLFIFKSKSNLRLSGSNNSKDPSSSPHSWTSYTVTVHYNPEYKLSIKKNRQLTIWLQDLFHKIINVKYQVKQLKITLKVSSLLWQFKIRTRWHVDTLTFTLLSCSNTLILKLVLWGDEGDIEWSTNN